MYFLKNKEPLTVDMLGELTHPLDDNPLLHSILVCMVTIPDIKRISFKPEAPFLDYDTGLLFHNEFPKTRVILYNTKTKRLKEIAFLRYYQMVTYYQTNHIVSDIGVSMPTYMVLKKFMERMLKKNANCDNFVILKCPVSGKLFPTTTDEYIDHLDNKKTPVLSNDAFEGMGLYSTDATFVENFTKDQFLFRVSNKCDSALPTLYAPMLPWYNATHDSLPKSRDFYTFKDPVLHSDFSKLDYTININTAKDDVTMMFPILEKDECVLLYDIASVLTSARSEIYDKPDSVNQYMSIL